MVDIVEVPLISVVGKNPQQQRGVEYLPNFTRVFIGFFGLGQVRFLNRFIAHNAINLVTITFSVTTQRFVLSKIDLAVLPFAFLL